MKVFKKTALLISVLVLAVVLSVGVIAGVAEAAEASATLGEVYNAVQVTTDGRVNLKVYYSNLGSAEKFIAEVVDPDSYPGESNGTKRYEYPVTELEQDATYGYCVKVPLAPAQMNRTVRVWASSGDGDSEDVKEFTVVDYVSRALKNDDNAKYFDALRALLNWGAMAQTNFGVDADNLANTDVFARGTNPLNVVNASSTGVATSGEGSEAFKSVKVSLEEGTISMKFIVEIADTSVDALSSSYTREGLTEAQDLTVSAVGGDRYSVNISNISVQNWKKAYTVTVKNGEDTYEYAYSLMNYLTYILTDGNVDTNGEAFSEAQQNVAKTMYQFYQTATGNTGAADCAHTAHAYWADNGTDADLKCSECFTVLRGDVPDEVDEFMTSYLVNGSQSNDVLSPMTRHNMQTSMGGANFAKLDLFNPNAAASQLLWYRAPQDVAFGTATIQKLNLDVGQAEYLVVRVRTNNNELPVSFNISTTGKNSDTAEITQDTLDSAKDDTHYLDSNGNALELGNLYNKNSGYKGIKLPLGAAENDTWATYVFKLSDIIPEYYVAVDGKYVVDTFYMHFDTVDDVDTDLDIEFMAFVDGDDWANVASIIDEETFYKVTDTAGAYKELNTADHTCIGEHTLSESASGNTYTYTCSVCGETLKTVSVPGSVTKYVSVKEVATGATQYYQAGEGSLHYKDGVAYARSIGNLQILWCRAQTDFSGGTGDHLNKIFADVGNAEYLVIKARVAADGNLSVTLSTEGKNGNPDGDDENTYPESNGYKSVTLVSSNKGDGEWHTYVIDLKALIGDYWAKAEGAESYVVDTFYLGCGGTFDIAYMAFVDGGDDEYAAIDALVEEKTIYKLTATAGAYVELNTADHTCLGDHTETVQGVNGVCAKVCTVCGHVGDTVEHTKGSMQNVDGVYKFPCTICGAVLRDTGVSVDAVNTLWPAETLHVKATQTGTAASGYSSITGSYAQKELITEDGETFLRLGDAKAGSGGWGGWFPISMDGKNGITDAGRYMVMKVRNHSSSGAWSTIPFWIVSSVSREAMTDKTWADGSFTVSLPQDDTWHVIVVDLAARSSAYAANEDGTYDLVTMHLRPMGGNGTSLDSTTDEVFDIAYMAFFDELTDIKGIVQEDIFELSKSSSSNAVMDTETGTCKYHTPTYTTDAEDERGYHYECSECGTVLAMDYYESGKGGCFAYNNGQYAGTATLKTDEAGFQYMSFLSTGTSGTFFNYNANNTGGGGVSDNAVRAGRYLVMKLKGDTAANVTFHIGTDDIDKTNGGNYQGGSVGALTIDTMPKDWTVVVVDLYGLTNYTMGGTHKIFMSSTTGGGTAVANGAQVDLAYVMLVNDFADIAGLTAGENVQYYGKTLDNTPVAVADMCDGTNHTYELTTTTENSVTTNTAKCLECGSTKVQTVSADINWYAPLDDMGIFQGTLTKNRYDAENGVVYNRYVSTGGNHLNLTGGSGGGSYTSGSFATGKYIVIKYRTEGSLTLSFNVATSDKKIDNERGVGVGNSQKDANLPGMEWRVAVLDVSETSRWTSDGSAQQLYIMMNPNAAGTVDIAYVAMVDDIAEAQSLLVDGETYCYLGTNWNNTPVELNKDGTCVDGCTREVTYTETDGVRTYAIACGACGTTFMSDLNWYAAGADMGSFYNAPGIEGVGATSEEEDGVSYKHHVLNWDGTNGTGGIAFIAPQSGTTYSVDTGKYLVLKMRGSSAYPAELSASTGDASRAKCGSSSGISLDNWTIVVVDLTSSANYTADTTAKLNIWFNIYNKAEFDIAYAAIVDTTDEAKKLITAMGEDVETFKLMSTWDFATATDEAVKAD